MPLNVILVPPQETPAPETEGKPESGGLGGMLMPLLLVAGIFWIVLIGPERKNRKKRQAMIDQIGKGDKVMTTSGIYAAVVQVQDDVVTLQVADSVRMRFSKSAIQGVLEEPDESGKDADSGKSDGDSKE